jgi:hypothetical protein
MITLGTQYLHSYPVAANGTIKAQVSQINTESYGGGDCPSAGTAAMDLSGQYVYVQNCSNYQTFQIATTSGALDFRGFTNTGTSFSYPLVISGNDQYAFDMNPYFDGDPEDTTVQVLKRQSDGVLEYWNSLNGSLYEYSLVDGDNFPWILTAGTANTMAVSIASVTYPDGPNFPVNEPTVIASYTMDSGGNLNSMGNPLIPDVGPTVMNISPSGKLLAVGGDYGVAKPLPLVLGPSGLEVYHFNGADPITPYTKPLNDAPIDQIHWDNNAHLYALSDQSNLLYVYTVTPTSFSQAPGSPYKINGSANALVVVPSLCGAPASAGVTICLPASGSTVNSPVLVEAAATVTGTIVSTQLWVDGVKNFNAPGSTTLTTAVTLAAGAHRFAVIATNTSGQKWESAVNAVVK